MVSGYHQCPVDEASSDLLVIATPSGRYRLKVLARGVCLASDVFNIVTEGSTRLDSNVIKNIDNVYFFGDTLQDLEKYVVEFCKEKNGKSHYNRKR